MAVRNFRGRHYGLLLVGALILSSCAPGFASKTEQAAADASKAADENVESLPPPFRATGSEPPWSMEWDGSLLKVSVGIEQEMTSFTDLAAEVTPKGWRLTTDSDFDLMMLRKTCLDLAAKPHDVDIDASMRGQRLVGCGDWIE